MTVCIKLGVRISSRVSSVSRTIHSQQYTTASTVHSQRYSKVSTALSHRYSTVLSHRYSTVLSHRYSTVHSHRYSTVHSHRYSTVSNETRKLTQLIYHEAPDMTGIVELCLNRPGARNALSKALVDEIVTGVDTVSNDRGVRCVLLRSLVDGVFCAGADLKERLTMTTDQVSEFVSKLRAMTSSIEAIPVPVIAVLEGSAYGGGLEIALACDMRVAASGVLMGLVETKLAIIPGAGGTQRLPRIVGVSLAKELIYTGRMLDGKEAKDCHLVSHLVPQNSEHSAAYLASLRIAREIAANGPVAVRAAKAAIDRGLRVDQESGMVVESFCYERVIRTQDRIEGLKSFAGKYKPVYKGN